jgi:hypothetical protein
MGWFSNKNTQDYGNYLPDEDATLQSDTQIVSGKNEAEAEENCKELASQYDAIESDVEETKDDGFWNCNFKFWS